MSLHTEQEANVNVPLMNLGFFFSSKTSVDVQNIQKTEIQVFAHNVVYKLIELFSAISAMY